jgi:hypothetical protein
MGHFVVVSTKFVVKMEGNRLEHHQMTKIPKHFQAVGYFRVSLADINMAQTRIVFRDVRVTVLDCASIHQDLNLEQEGDTDYMAGNIGPSGASANLPSKMGSRVYRTIHAVIVDA